MSAVVFLWFGNNKKRQQKFVPLLPFQTRMCLVSVPAVTIPALKRKPRCPYGYGNAVVCDDYFPWCSSETVSFLRPCARREASTRRPFLVFMRSRKPCLFTRRRFVWLECSFHFIVILLLFCFIVYNSQFGLQKYVIILK